MSAAAKRNVTREFCLTTTVFRLKALSSRVLLPVAIQASTWAEPMRAFETVEWKITVVGRATECPRRSPAPGR